jgi:hypothetical protein
MPVCEETITKSVKNAQYKPGKGGKRKCNKIPLSKGFYNPPKQIEKDQTDMENVEEDI